MRKVIEASDRHSPIMRLKITGLPVGGTGMFVLTDEDLNPIKHSIPFQTNEEMYFKVPRIEGLVFRCRKPDIGLIFETPICWTVSESTYREGHFAKDGDNEVRTYTEVKIKDVTTYCNSDDDLEIKLYRPEEVDEDMLEAAYMDSAECIMKHHPKPLREFRKQEKKKEKARKKILKASEKQLRRENSWWHNDWCSKPWVKPLTYANIISWLVLIFPLALFKPRIKEIAYPVFADITHYNIDATGTWFGVFTFLCVVFAVLSTLKLLHEAGWVKF